MRVKNILHKILQHVPAKRIENRLNRETEWMHNCAEDETEKAGFLSWKIRRMYEWKKVGASIKGREGDRL